jgi:predicted metal-dependent peptidase
MQHPEKVTEAISAVLASPKTAFFAVYLMQRMQIKYDPAVKTARTNGRDIVVGDWFCGLNTKQAVFVLAHEILHGVLDHMPRAELYRQRGFGIDLKPFSDQRANKAMDAVINAALVEARIGEMPEGGIFRSRDDADKTWDAIYPEFEEDEEDEGFDEHEPAPDGAEEGDADHKQALQQAVNAAKAQGTLPGAIGRMVEEVLNPTQPWVDVLRDFVTNCTGRDETSYRRLNRRRLVTPPNLALPGYDGHHLDTMVVAIDTSGSISDREMSAFTGELAGIIEDVSPRELHVIWWDTEAVAELIEDGTVDDLDQLEAYGGGGTSYDCVPKKIDELGIDPDVVVCFTDGYVSWPGADTIQWPHITVSTSTNGAPFGANIQVEVSNG